MTTAQFLSIILIFIYFKPTNIRAEIPSVGAEKITLNKCCPFGKYVSKRKICRNTANIRSQDIYTNFDFTDLKLYSESMEWTKRHLKDVYELDDAIFEENRNFKISSFDFSLVNLIPYLTETGTLYLEAPNEYVRWIEVNSSNFCVDYFWPGPQYNATPHFWAIFVKEAKSSDPLYITIGLLTSCVFLALVLVVYLLLPELQNLNGLVVMAYVASLFCAFLLLAVHQVGNGSYDDTACLLLTYFCYFSFLASFCWMNIMSYDIWWTFRGFVKARPIHRFGERFKFKMYCLYAFGIPLAMTVFFITVNHVPMRHLPGFITPHVPSKGCFINDEEKLPYLYAPMLIMILMNWLFFLMTSYEIWSMHQQTAILDTAAAGTRAAHRQHRARLLVYLKLSILMGINWVLEIVSYLTPTLYVWYVTDAYNFLIGISIFIIFVCKRTVLRKLKKRYHDWRESDNGFFSSRSHSSHTSGSDGSQEVPLRVCPHPDASFKHRAVERRFVFN